jgi:hypothetical protein
MVAWNEVKRAIGGWGPKLAPSGALAPREIAGKHTSCFCIIYFRNFLLLLRDVSHLSSWWQWMRSQNEWLFFLSAATWHAKVSVPIFVSFCRQVNFFKPSGDQVAVVELLIKEAAFCLLAGLLDWAKSQVSHIRCARGEISSGSSVQRRPDFFLANFYPCDCGVYIYIVAAALI